MTTPAYITDQNVFFSDVTTPAALLMTVGTTDWVLPFDVLVTVHQREDLDDLVTANGGSLPLTSEQVARTLKLSNGQSWYDTYIGITLYVDPTQLPTYDEFHGGGSGGGGDYTLLPATTSRLGGVIVPLDSGLSVAANGSVAVNMNALPPVGDEGQILVSVGTNGSPVWQDMDGGSY